MKKTTKFLIVGFLILLGLGVFGFFWLRSGFGKCRLFKEYLFLSGTPLEMCVENGSTVLPDFYSPEAFIEYSSNKYGIKFKHPYVIEIEEKSTKDSFILKFDDVGDSNPMSLVVTQNFQAGDSRSYLEDLPSVKKTKKIGDNTWNFFQLKDADFGDFTYSHLSALRLEKNGILYTVQIPGQEDLDSIQEEIISTFEFFQPE